MKFILRQKSLLSLTGDMRVIKIVNYYFTMIYGVIDNKKRKLTLTQAGHPSPLYIPFRGEPSFIGTGGFPVGRNVSFDRV